MAASLANPQVHEALLEQLRRHGTAPKTNKSVNQEIPFSKELAMQWPLLLAAWRCKLVRDFLALTLGVLLIAGGYVFRPLALLGLLLLALSLRGLPGGSPFMEVRTQAGFYAGAGPHAARNARFRGRFEAFLRGFAACPWQRSGELCTILPYFINLKRFKRLDYVRCWLEAEDGESFAFDWVFPATGHEPGQPVVALLTGLAPNQHWTQAAGFIADAAWHLTQRCKMTVVVLVARGTMDTEVNKNLFHGARVTDLRQMLEFTHVALRAAALVEPRVFAAGYSMGAIILANYCGRFADPLLVGGIHFSGLHDAVFNINFEYSAQTWQAFLAYNLKKSFISAATVEEARKRGVDIDRVMSGKVVSVVDIDKDFVSIYNGYDGILDYYRDLSLASDEKWRNVKIPLLAVAARDDPITHCDALRAAEFSEANPNLLFLITDRGGHVGWPEGMWPWKHGWDFMNKAIQIFIEENLSDALVSS